MGICDSKGGGGGHHGMSDEERIDRFFDGSFERYRGRHDSCFYQQNYINLVRDLSRELNCRYIPEDRIKESWRTMSPKVGWGLSETEYYRMVKPHLKHLIHEYRY